MKVRRLLLLFVCVSCAGRHASPASTGMASPDEAYVRACADWSRLDAKATAENYTSDAVVVLDPQLETFTTRAQLVAELQNEVTEYQRYGLARIDCDYVPVSRVTSGPVVSDVGYGRDVLRQIDGSRSEVYFRFSATLTQDDAGRWRFASSARFPVDKLEARNALQALPQRELPKGSGAWGIWGEVQSSDCEGIMLAARHVFVDPPSRRLLADVVNRTYVLETRSGGLSAHGTFTGYPECGAGSLVEDWDFQAKDARRMEGTLKSAWKVPPLCTKRCTAVFAIHAEAND